MTKDLRVGHLLGDAAEVVLVVSEDRAGRLFGTDEQLADLFLAAVRVVA